MNNYWGQFPKTDPKYTKVNKQGGRASTAITPVYMVKLATDVLGPIGERWGYRVLEERFDNGAPIVLIQAANSENKMPVYMMDNGSIVYEKNHTVLLEMWVGEKNNTFCQYGHTKYSYLTKTGKYYVDDEYGKKSITDAMTKCLSLIGVCSDVYMGEFDDVNYQEAARIESDIAKADDINEEIKKKTKEFDDHINQNIELMCQCPTFDAVAKVYGLAHSKAKLLGAALRMNEQAALEEIESGLEEKAGSILFLIANMKGDIEKIKAEEKRLSEKRKAAEKTIERLKDYLIENMQAQDKQKIDNGVIKCSIIKPRPVLVLSDESLVPDNFKKITVSSSVDKKQLLAHLKDLPEGEKVDGASIGQSKIGLTIK